MAVVRSVQRRRTYDGRGLTLYRIAGALIAEAHAGETGRGPTITAAPPSVCLALKAGHIEPPSEPGAANRMVTEAAR